MAVLRREEAEAELPLRARQPLLRGVEPEVVAALAPSTLRRQPRFARCLRAHVEEGRTLKK